MPPQTEKRESDRIPMKIPVRCIPMGSETATQTGVEIWTSDVHPLGTGLEWLISSKPQTCPICQSTVKDLNCQKDLCPYKALHDVLMDCGWLQIQGLNTVPGWEKEEKILAKVMWFKLEEEGLNFQFGVRFSRERPPVRIEVAAPILPQEIETDDPNLQQVHELDMERWKAALRIAHKQVLIVDEDKIESGRLTETMEGLGFTGKTVSSDLISMLNHFVDNPQVIFFNPVFGGSLKMDILGNLRRACPDTKLALIVDPAYKTEILDSANFHLANYLFIKPLDFERIKDAFGNV